MLAIALNNLGGVMQMLGESERAAAYFEESLELRRRIGDLSRIALGAVPTLPSWRSRRGRQTRLPPCSPRRPRSPPRSATNGSILFALAGLGRVAYREERWEEAGTHARESLRLAQELGMKLPAVDVEILWLAGIAAATGNTARAGRLAAAAAFHLSLLAPDEADDPDYQEIIESVKAACDPETWEQASAKGRTMTLDEAADYALSSA